MAGIKNLCKKGIFLLCLLISLAASAQNKGAFSTNINFLGQPRKLSLYVPTDYDSTKAYQLMICLHGLGDNCTNYRDALINSLQFNKYFPNTIFVCPEAATTSSDFLLPAGNEAIINKCIDYARQNYTIDSTNIILQGFSLGGRSALKYGLDHYSMFKGLLLNTPAVQGVKEALNKSFYKYTYANAAHIPIYITHGVADLFYTGAIDTVFYELAINNGIVRRYEVPNMGHSVPNASKMQDVLPFFNAPGTGTDVLEIVRLFTPHRTCTGTAAAQVLIRNTGYDSIIAATLKYTLNGNSQTYNWTGSLGHYEHALVSLPALSVSDGVQALKVQITSLNSGIPDTATIFNQLSDTFLAQSKGRKLPFFDGFENSDSLAANWAMNSSGELYSEFGLDNTVKRSGSNSMTAFNTILLFDNLGRKEEMMTPILDLTSISSPKLDFDVTYDYQKYTPPYLTVDTVFADTLEVLISTDCGGSYHSLFKKGGKDLATFAKPILNPTSLQACFLHPADSNWRTEEIDLSPYAGNTAATIVFRYISGLGGFINIDNVKINSTGLGIAKQDQSFTFQVYPNPATNMVNISAGNEHIRKVEVFDLLGKSLFSVLNDKGSANTMQLNTGSLHPGVYLFQIYTETGVHSARVLIR